MKASAGIRSYAARLLLTTAAAALLVTALTPLRNDLQLLNVGFIFLLFTLIVASIWGREVGLFAAVLTNLAFNYFFIEPLHTFTVQAPRNVLALFVFLAVSVIGGGLLSVARRSARDALRREAEAEAALGLAHAMSRQTQPEAALEALCREVTSLFVASGAAILMRGDGGWHVLAAAGKDSVNRAPTQEESVIADRAAAEGRLQGLGLTRLGSERARRIVVPAGRGAAFARQHAIVFVPLRLGNRVLGVLRLDGPLGESAFRESPEALLNAVAGEAATTLQRFDLAREAAHASALREADEMKTALMASISHDLKTPLAGIKAAVSSLLDQGVVWSEEDVASFLRVIDSQADRLNRVISDILDLNRIESGDLTPEQSPLLARNLLEEARETTRLETAGREVTIDAADAVWLLADEALIGQAIVNLIENAAKYSKPGAAIHLDAERRGGSVVISVEDEGPGIASEDLPFVFQRFYRAQEQSRRVKGSGIGLTIVKGFVELCGGTVQVESSSAGTRFTITLPAASGADVVTA